MEFLGLTKSFNASFFCRNCTRSITETKSDINEFKSSYRNGQNYNQALAIVNEQERIKKTGKKENSILNQLTNFHVTRNFSFDIMHDLRPLRGSMSL